jgi:antirestriction protein ArdC
MRPSREEIQQEALSRAVNGQTLSNWPAIFAGFMAKGIPESDIKPRENVLTYHAWRALGRQVRRGEHGVKVTTFVECESKSDAAEEGNGTDKAKRRYRRPWTATVFHISQTDSIAA